VTQEIQYGVNGDIVEDPFEIARCLAGEKLYGDDFASSEIEAWFKDEEDAYFNLGGKKRNLYTYGYHALNWQHGYSALPEMTFRHVLGIGSAYGDELFPITSHASRITIVEASSGFREQALHGVPLEYVKPHPSGELPFRSGAFDLITCLGVLHHIPNVSTVLGEIYRCAAPGGYVLLREPVVSMGDWRKPRKGLTKRERGIPLRILRSILTQDGFEISRERSCMFPLTIRIQPLVRVPVFNSRVLTCLDSLICRLPIWPRAYHPRWAFDKLRPQSVFFVLRKQCLQNERSCNQ
jgi:SAM-dependent methyltransferase